MNESCKCSQIALGNIITEQRNWNPDCGVHGLESEWYRSDEQKARRNAEREELIRLYDLVKARRAKL